MTEAAILKRAIAAASKKLRFAPAKRQNAVLALAADDLADAYRIGAEEAQDAIIGRLRELLAKTEAKP